MRAASCPVAGVAQVRAPAVADEHPRVVTTEASGSLHVSGGSIEGEGAGPSRGKVMNDIIGDNRAAEMDAFRGALAEDHLQPLWDIMQRLAAKQPVRGGVPIHWSWDHLRRHVMRAGDLVTAEEAERRVIVLENPSFPGEGKITSSLYSGIQLILPGETAPSHRHTASALRLILEGQGAFTTVAGERISMSPGDFIVTPSNSFHDHGNDTDQPVLWLDGLDVFVVNLLNAPFGEDHPEQRQPVTRPAGDSLARYGRGLVPHDHRAIAGETGTFWWPYTQTRSALVELRAAGPVDDALGVRMNFIDPSTGASPIKTMTASMSLFPDGFRGAQYRSVAGSVWSVVEGRGRVRVGEQSWEIGPRDVVVVPGWAWHQVEADEALIIFSFSDEVLQRHLGFWREERSGSVGAEA
jgi:gentisate 1,2-dioxygenase